MLKVYVTSLNNLYVLSLKELFTLIIPFLNRDRCQKSTINICSQLWNVLSDDIISLEYANFRKRVRRNDIFNLLCDKNLVKIINVYSLSYYVYIILTVCFVISCFF